MERAYQRIVSAVLDDIVTGRLAAGERLPRLDDLAARHACSRGVAREAMRALEERRLIRVQAGQRRQVLDTDHWMLLDHDVAEAALLRHPDPQLLRESVEFVGLVETRAALLAAPKVRKGDVLELSQILDQMRASARDGDGAQDGGDTFPEAEAGFHRFLILLARNRFLASSVEDLHPTLALARRQRAPHRDPMAIALHERIVVALAERDPTAAAAATDDYSRHFASWLRV